MGFEAKVILASMSPTGHPITTMQLRYPRFIHAEFMTHREFSRNASSSRAIPVAKMIEQVRDDPAMPIHWGANQPGMQAHAELAPEDIQIMQNHWHLAAMQAADQAEFMEAHGLHKQVANRILEPFQWMHVIMTTTSFTNFDGLRRHKDAQPEIKHLADLMAEAYENAYINHLSLSDWHLPYIQHADWQAARVHLFTVNNCIPTHDETINVLIAMSAARCARVSYLTHDGKVPSVADDLKLYQRLVGSQPLHASPTEHQATPDSKFWSSVQNQEIWEHPEEHGNLYGWRQFRKMLPNEYITD